MSKPDLDQDIGAEFEENDPPAPKVVINDKPRVKSPEYMGDKPASGTEPDKPHLTDTKSNTLKPDISDKEARPQEAPVSDESQVVDELAKAAVDKKTAKDSGEDSTDQKNIQSLIDSKTYFVPTGQVTKRRNTKIVLGVLLALIVAGTIGFVLMSSASQ